MCGPDDDHGPAEKLNFDLLIYSSAKHQRYLKAKKVMPRGKIRNATEATTALLNIIMEGEYGS